MVTSPIILQGPKDERVYPAVSLGAYFHDLLPKYGDKVAQVQQVDGVEVSVTYSQLLRHGKIVSGLLREHGLGSGDTVMLCCGNTLQFAPIMLGTLFAGATIAPVNPAFGTSDLLHLIGTIKPTILICNDLAEPNIKEALAQYIPKVVMLPMEAVKMRLKEDLDVEDFFLGKVDDPTTHVAFVMCSSGTSGKPKGVEMIDNRILRLLLVTLMPETNMEVALNLSGPFWVSCMFLTLYSLNKGMELVLLAPFQEEEYLSTVQKYKVNFSIIGPDHLVRLAKFPTYSSYDLSSLHSILYGGAPITHAMIKMAQETLHKNITVLYGMTEGMGFLIPRYDVHDKPCNVGVLGDNVSAKVVDINTGETVGANCEGELCFKTDTSFKGYRGNREATEDMFDADGFLHTGDIGYYDKDGFFFIVDRLKELIKYKRDHVPATDIEEVLVKHPGVLDAAVIGIFHETDWEHATAVVERRPGVDVTEDELVKLVEGKLPEMKWLHGGVHFIDSLPRTATGKVQKHVLRKVYSK